MSEFWHSFNPSMSGALFMWVLAFTAAFMVAISTERLCYIIGKSNINSYKFMALIRKYILEREYKKAVQLCRSFHATPLPWYLYILFPILIIVNIFRPLKYFPALPEVVLTGIIKAAKMKKPSFRAVQNAVDEGTLEVIPKLQSRIGYLNMIGNVATLIGLMGTIFGLIIAFRSVSAPGIDAAEKSRLLAHGIAVAMNTTLFGLAVAIPSIISYTYLHNKTNHLIDEIDEHTVKLINLMTEEE